MKSTYVDTQSANVGDIRCYLHWRVTALVFTSILHAPPKVKKIGGFTCL